MPRSNLERQITASYERYEPLWLSESGYGSATNIISAGGDNIFLNKTFFKKKDIALLQDEAEILPDQDGASSTKEFPP